MQVSKNKDGRTPFFNPYMDFGKKKRLKSNPLKVCKYTSTNDSTLKGF